MNCWRRVLSVNNRHLLADEFARGYTSMGSRALKSDATDLPHSSFELLHPALFRGTPKVDLMSTVWRPPPLKVRMPQRLFVILSFQQTSLFETTVLGNLTQMAVPWESNLNNGVIKRYQNFPSATQNGPSHSPVGKDVINFATFSLESGNAIVTLLHMTEPWG